MALLSAALVAVAIVVRPRLELHELECLRRWLLYEAIVAFALEAVVTVVLWLGLKSDDILYRHYHDAERAQLVFFASGMVALVVAYILTMEVHGIQYNDGAWRTARFLGPETLLSHAEAEELLWRLIREKASILACIGWFGGCIAMAVMTACRLRDA